MPESAEKRLRGWKSIATHLGVTQSTAIRWSKRPGFPVVRSAQAGSVYALPSALDAWLAAQGGEVADEIGESAIEPAMPRITEPAQSRRWLLWGAGGAAALAAVTTAGVVLTNRRNTAAPVAGGVRITDPELRALYLDARADWAARTPESLNRAVAKFQEIIARYPDFGPGFSGLADAYILSCEFGNMDRDLAFRQARSAINTALALDPEDADANRALGFLEYWTSRDIHRATPYFKRAERARPGDYLIFLWHGNALVNAGQVREGVDRLDHAVDLAPESAAVLTDHAIALWQAGDEQQSLARLADVQRRIPTHSPAHGTAALFHIARNDVAAYLDASERWSALIPDEAQAARLRRERAAFVAGGANGALMEMASAPALVSAFWHGGNLPAAIAASHLGARDLLIQRLKLVIERAEAWRRLRFPMQAFVRWRGDAELTALLDKAMPPLE